MPANKTAEKKSYLQPCPMCGADADVLNHDRCTITCSKLGCRLVIGSDFHEAQELWNKPKLSG